MVRLWLQCTYWLYYYRQLCCGSGQGCLRWQLETTGIPVEELEPNPVVQGVKLIMVIFAFQCKCNAFSEFLCAPQLNFWLLSFSQQDWHFFICIDGLCWRVMIMRIPRGCQDNQKIKMGLQGMENMIINL